MGKNYLITGAARGIGRGLSRLLLQRGHSVFLVDNNKTELGHTIQHLAENASGSNYSTAICDLCEPSEIRLAIEKAGKFFNGQLDVLINNAAYTGAVGATPFADLSLDTWNRSIQTNLTGAMLMSQGCLPLLRKGAGREKGGSIIHMSSTRAHQSEPNSEGYAATKAGLIGLRTPWLPVWLVMALLSMSSYLDGSMSPTNAKMAVNGRTDYQKKITGGTFREELVKLRIYCVRLSTWLMLNLSLVRKWCWMEVLPGRWCTLKNRSAFVIQAYAWECTIV